MEEVNAAVFEGLFVRALKVDGAFAGDLRRAGVDLANLEPKYPVETWFAALDVARRRLYPGLSEIDAHRELGRTFLDGYARTLVGSVLMAAAPMVGPARLVSRVPRMLMTARPTGIRATAREIGPREWVVDVQDRFAAPGFHAGLIERGLNHCRANARIVIENRTDEGFSLRITW